MDHAAIAKAREEERSFESVFLGIETLRACPVCRALVEDFSLDIQAHIKWHRKLGDWTL